MLRSIPAHIARQAEAAVATAFAEGGVVNVSTLSEALRARNAGDNIALEDFEWLVLGLATVRNAIVLFDRNAPTANVFGKAPENVTLADRG